MSVPFTVFDETSNWADRALFNEIYDAYSERRQAVNQSFKPSKIVGHVSVDVNDWQEMQNFIEGTVFSWTNHDGREAPGAWSDQGENPPQFTLSTFRSVAGLHPSGFRRATRWTPGVNDWTDINDSMYEYGISQVDDIRGPWLNVDMQNALSALKHTGPLRFVTDRGDGETDTRIASAADSDCATAASDQNTAWSSSVWSRTDFGDLYKTLARIVTGITVGGERRRWRWELNNIPVANPTAIDVYILIDSAIPGGVFEDIDSLGLVEDQLYLQQSVNAGSSGSSSRGGESEGDWVGNIEANPVSLSSVGCPIQSIVGARASKWTYVLRWQFTRSN